MTDQIRVFRARKVITMNPSWPEGTAVAVRGNHILEVGTLETLEPWLSRHSHTVDDTFGDHVLLPGFIDPHLHPSMAAVLLPMHFITAMEWDLPWDSVQPVTTHDGFLERVKILSDQLEDPAEPLFTWGYHPLWHGEVRRPQLDQVAPDRPVVVWHRSFHEVILNSAALRWLEIDEESIRGKIQIDLDGGHFFENGLFVAISRLNPHILSPERYRHGLERLKQVAHHGGHTTLGDLAVGLFDPELEWQGSLDVLEQDDTPFRVLMVRTAASAFNETRDWEKTVELVQSLPSKNLHRLQFSDHVKMFSDGAFFSLLAQLQEPGYLDGHLGEWLTPPESFERVARLYWNAGLKIHVHCTGDLGLELALDTLEKLQWERPRFRHGYTIEHFGFATPEQVDRIAELGAAVSANVYYLHELSHIYAQGGVGTERAHQMARLGSCVRRGIRTAVHSDFTMAPASPLNSAWVAATRRNCEGDVVGPHERLSVEEALRAITLDAAYMLGLDHEVGSLRAGKKADFTVLDEDPFEVGADGLRDLQVKATVFEGEVFEVGR